MKRSQLAIIIVCIGIIAWVMWISSITKEHMNGGISQEKTSSCEIPKRIWTYWDGDMPILVHMCLESWMKHNPHFDIVLLTKANLHKYINIDLNTLTHANFGPAMFSDFVRLHVLATHGGIWMDASVICNTSLDWMCDIQQQTGCTFIGYKMKSHTPDHLKGVRDVIENSVFACTPYNKLVIAWRDEFMKINQYTNAQDYIESIVQQGIDVPLRNAYWSAYASYVAVMYNHPEFNEFMYLLEGTETIYVYQYDNADLPHDQQVASLFDCRYKDQPLLKLSSWDRYVIHNNHPDASLMFCRGNEYDSAYR